MISFRSTARMMCGVLIASTLLAAQDTKPIPSQTSPGQAIQNAAQASVHDTNEDRPKSTDGQAGNLEVLTNTQGVNFGPYLNAVQASIRKNWYALIPDDSQMKKGKLAIAFAIRQDGSITNMHIVATSGDSSLDRAAWDGITHSTPFAALPSAFTGPYLALRFRFLYNLEGVDLAGNSKLVHAIMARSIEDSGLPEYPRKAVDEKIEGMVRLEALVAPNGKVESVTTVDGNLILGTAAAQAIRKWTFHPAQRDGMPVEDRVRINVEFHLEGEQVRAQVVSPDVPQPSSVSPSDLK